MATDPQVLRKVAEDDKLMYEVGRRAVEDVLVSFRNGGISVLGRNNGLVINFADGTPSSIIRLPIESAVRTAMLAMADHLEKESE